MRLFTNMIGRVFILTILSTCVLSLPVTSGQLENEDVKVMKCIVEALADVLSRPHPVPVSQDCLLTLKTDDRLVAILRHHNFLKELQEIAFQGGQKRAQEEAPVQETKTERNDDTPDRSMLESLGGPGEQSILSQRKRIGTEEEGEGKVEGSLEAKEIQDKRDDPQEDNARSLLSESVEDWSETEKRDKEEENKEKHGHKNKKGSEHSEKIDSTKNKSKEENVEEEEDKRSGLHPHKQDDKKGDMKRNGLKLWSKRAKGSQMKKKAAEKETQEEEEVPHHSKELPNEEEEAEKRSPEEKELQMIARRAPEEKRGSDEEGSGTRKEAEIESLATIESELESVAQKLHDLSEADRRLKRG